MRASRNTPAWVGSPCTTKLAPEASSLREDLKLVLTSSQVCWRDYFAPQDSLCFSHTDPRLLLEAEATPGPPGDFVQRSAIYDNVFAARKIAKFRLNFLRMHFQFLMAPDTQGGFDWFRLSLARA